MYYFKYTEVITNNQNKFSLDKGNYSDKVEEYLSSHDINTGAGIYIVKADLDDKEYDVFIKLQRVTLQEITALDFEALASTSEDYQSKRQLDKINRANEIANAVVSYRGITFDADENAIARMSSRLSLYNFKFNQLLSLGKSTTEAYRVYSDRLLWRGTDKKSHDISVEELAFILQLAMSKIEDTIMKY